MPLVLAASGTLLAAAAWWFGSTAPGSPPPGPPVPAAPLPGAEPPVLPAPAPSDPAPEAGPPPVPATLLLVRRLYDGAPMPGFALRSGDEAGAEAEGGTLVTDAEGRVPIPSDSPGVPVPVDGAWRAIVPRPGEGERPPTLWVHDTVRIRVEVDFRPDGVEGDCSDVKVLASLPVPNHGGEEPWTASWLRSHGVAVDSIEGRPAGDPGIFTVEVTRLPGISVTAWREGWRPVSASLEVPAGVPEVDARLSLTPGLAISGVVRDESGRPLANATVHGFVLRTFPWDVERRIPSDLSRRFSPNGGLTLSRTRDGTLRVRVRERAFTDADGKFILYTKSEGRIALYLHEPGRRAARIDLGEIAEDRGGIVLDAPFAEGGPFVTILDGGALLPDPVIYCHDMTDPLTPSLEMVMDDRGRIPSDWLRTGHLYHFLRPRFAGNRGYLRFRGERVIDLALLPKDGWEDL